MSFPRENPRLPENINNSHESPLLDFLLMAGALVVLIVVISLGIGWSASWLGPHIPRDWEPDLVLKAEELNASDEAIQTYLQNLTSALIADIDDAPVLKVHYLPHMPDANAFATSGGNIHVTRGLLDAVESENGLAMVLAHEYAHIELRHPAVLMLEQLGHTLLYAFLGFGDSGAATFAQSTGMATLMSFSRDMERDADKRAVELLQATYGHSEGASELFEHLLASDEESPGNWGLWQSHPDTLERIERLGSSDGNIQKKGEEPIVLHPLPDWLIKSLKKDSGD